MSTDDRRLRVTPIANVRQATIAAIALMTEELTGLPVTHVVAFADPPATKVGSGRP